MKVRVKLFATLRKYGSDKVAQNDGLELAEGATIRQALAELGVPEPSVAFVFVNSRQRKLDESLADGDELGVFPAIAGG